MAHRSFSEVVVGDWAKERTNGIVQQQTGRWHRRQNKFGKMDVGTNEGNDPIGRELLQLDLTAQSV